MIHEGAALSLLPFRRPSYFEAAAFVAGDGANVAGADVQGNAGTWGFVAEVFGACEHSY